MVYKIGLVSTHGTGKSTLAALIAGLLKSRNIEAKYLEEVATEAKELGLPINEQTTLTAQLYILHKHFCNELVYSENRTNHPNYEVITCDRIGFDNYCYLERRLGRNEYALNMVLEHAKLYPYNRIYFLPIINPNIESGSGVRSVNQEFQLEMEQNIHEFLHEQKIDYISLPIPAENDPFREEWTKTIINQTLEDLEAIKRIKFDKRYYF